MLAHSAAYVAGDEILVQSAANVRAPGHAAGEGELDLGVVELLDIDALGHRSRHGGRLDDLHARCTHAMPRRHFLHPHNLHPSAFCCGAAAQRHNFHAHASQQPPGPDISPG